MRPTGMLSVTGSSSLIAWPVTLQSVP